MASSPPSRPDDNDCLRLPATPSPRTRGAEKKESTGLHLNQPCPPYVTPSSISSLGGRLSGVRTAENKSLKNSGANTFCQSSARLRAQIMGFRVALFPRLRGQQIRLSSPVNPLTSCQRPLGRR